MADYVQQTRVVGGGTVTWWERIGEGEGYGVAAPAGWEAADEVGAAPVARRPSFPLQALNARWSIAALLPVVLLAFVVSAAPAGACDYRKQTGECVCKHCGG